MTVALANLIRLSRYFSTSNRKIQSLLSLYSEDVYSRILDKCPDIKTLEKVHSRIIFDPDLCLNTSIGIKLMRAYAACGQTSITRQLFDKIPVRNVVVYNVMIRSYVNNRFYQDALLLFKIMHMDSVQPDRYTPPCVLKACWASENLWLGLQIHGPIIKNGLDSNLYTGNGLVAMYGKCGFLAEARRALDEMPRRDVISWNSMVAGYAQNGSFDDALEVCKEMNLLGVKPDAGTMASLLPAVTNTCMENVAFVKNMFLDMDKKDLVPWNVMMAVYVKNSMPKEAVEIYLQMEACSTEPDAITFATVLPACGDLSAVLLGRRIHEKVERRGLQPNLSLENALIDMYARCGCLLEARKLFDAMKFRDVVSWTSLIYAYGMSGQGQNAVALFSRMLESGLKPDSIAFVSILSACSHAGLLQAGEYFYKLMTEEYKIVPRIEHYACMVDLRARAGQIEKAYTFIKQMPMDASERIWGALLSACRVYNNMDIGVVAADHLFLLAPKQSGYYVLLSNIYAKAGRWQDVTKIRLVMNERGIKKIPGVSNVELHNQVHTFLAGDRLHPQSGKIYEELDTLIGKIKELGYVPVTDGALHDVEEEDKENHLVVHSEKLAIVFAILNTEAGTPIRITKNLRVCGDCHIAAKLISKITKRLIVVRDTRRYHHFQNGVCSCGWINEQQGPSVIMVREKDACWEYAEKLDGNKVRCKFCLRVLNGGISRLKHHLSRLPSKGVNPCTKVRDDVSDRVRAIIASKEEAKEISEANHKHKLVEAKSPVNISVGKALECVEPAATPIGKFFLPVTQPTLTLGSNEENAERSIALFFFENRLDFSVARSSSYQQMIDDVGKCGSGFVGPSAEALKTTWLERIKSEVNLQSKDMEKEWAMTGCTIIAEMWMDNKSRALINFLVSSSSRTFFHKSVDASSYYKNTKCLSELFDSIIQDFGPENIVQVIVDNALYCTGIVNHILQSYGTVFVSPCAVQCLNTILDEFSKVDWVNRCIFQAQTITKFIYNNSSVLDLMKKFTGHDIIRTGITKPVSNFLSLQSILKQRSRLKHMFNSPEFATSSACLNKPQSITCLEILDDNEFWRTVEECVALSEPFLKVMREVCGGKPVVGFIYELMTRAKESIRTYYIMDEIKCKTFLDIVDKKWQNNLHSPLHSAAAFLNPSIQYNTEVKFLGSLKEDFYRVLEKLLPARELRRDITNQICSFTRASGMFGCNLAKEAIDTVPPGIWWEHYGDAAPVLQRVAIRILSQVCGSFTFERDWTMFQQLHSEKRNKIDKETLNDTVYINYNLKLARLSTSKSTDTDPLQLEDIDMTSEWVEEAENPSPTQWLDRFGSALDGNDLNTRQFGAAIFGAGDPIFGL